MSLQQPSAIPDTTFTATPASLAQALEHARQAQVRLQQSKRRVTQLFMAVQALFCGYLLLKWIWQGHYIGGPIYAVLIWCLLWLVYLPVSLLWYPRQRAADQARRHVDAARMEAGKAFLADQALGPYRWICRGGRMLAVFSESRMLYVLGPEIGDRHALMDAQRVVKQVRVDERTITNSTTQTTTKHGRRNVYALTANLGMIGKGSSRSTTTTSSSTARTCSLHVQLQNAGQTPYWVQLPFASDWQEARNWQLLVEQAAGLKS
ncbi:hypothetical protein G7009_15735 [Pseudomonas capeferrum]|uniref:hypothetical protein n=1 Tax=Pseudomonas capeferrum TaxID=1495066 RepID=UPI0015E36E9B|nr:hypothetical protein [Pseudomonas capeferrum]MBA1203186.1 hypothetical protein [Pseudomonas capeferrum]